MLTTTHGLHTADQRAAYLAALNHCFPGWGGQQQWAWCFDRIVAGHAADFMQIISGGSIVAGSAVTYRSLHLPDGDACLIGIMTGSWTLPEARGKGAFTRIIQDSREAAARRGARALLAFVTTHNPSRRRLEAEGAALIPTRYCRSAGAHGALASTLRELPRGSDLDLREDDVPRKVAFGYDRDEWLGQFVERPGDIRLVEHPGRWTAVVERSEQFDRLHALRVEHGTWSEAVDALIARAQAAGRQLFVFTASTRRAADLRDRQFDIVEGFLTVLPLEGAGYHGLERASSMDWRLQNGDRM